MEGLTTKSKPYFIKAVEKIEKKRISFLDKLKTAYNKGYNDGLKKANKKI
jgi:hypothetical protein